MKPQTTGLLDVVGWTLSDMMAELTEFGCQRESRPEEYRRAEHERQGQLTRCSSDGWLVADGKLNLKYARVQAARMDVATAMVYPTACPGQLPIFACEWVVVAPRVHVIVLDIEFAARPSQLHSKLEPLLMPLAQRWQSRFPSQPEVPAWFRDIAEPWAIFSAGSLDDLPSVRQAMGEYLAVAIGVYRQCLPTAQAGADHPDVTAYKHHHYDHSPNSDIGAYKFGSEFTERLLRDWHFGPSGVPESGS